MSETLSPPEGELDQSLPGGDRRSGQRFSCRLDVTCHPLTAARNDPHPAQIRNLSAGGVALTLARRFDTGTLLAVRVETTVPGGSRTLLARVVHATAQPDDGWLLGCALTGELDREELQAFLADRVSALTPDCRTWVSVLCEVETTLQEGRPGLAPEWPAKILNISPGGVGLLVPNRFAQGARLRVQLPGVSGAAGHGVVVRVVHALELVGRGWFLGCAFAKRLSDEEMRELLS
jgi:hypothetical protein